MTETTIPNDKKIKPIQRFWSLLRPDYDEIKNVYIYAIFSGLISLSLPLGIQAIINLIQGGQISTSWAVLIAFVITGIIISGYLQMNQLKITENLQQKIFTRAAFDFGYRIPRVKLTELYNKNAPELMNRFFDVMSIQKGLSKIIIDFSTASIQTVFGLILLSIYHPFFIVFSAFLLLLVYIVFVLTAKKGLQTSIIESKNKYKTANWLQEVARSSVAFKLSNDDNLTLDVINKYAGKYISAREDHFAVLIRQFKLLIGFKVIVAAGLLIIGSLLVMDQQMNIGQFVAAEIIIILVINSVEKLILSLETIYDVLTSLEKVGEVTDLELDSDHDYPGVMEVCNSNSFEIENLTFSHKNQSKNIFENFNLTISKGSKNVISGEIGSGKKTLIHLLAGLYQPTSGTIAMNNVLIKNYNPHTLHEQISVSTEDDCIFEGSVMDNITLGRAKATFQNVKWISEKIGLSDFINKLPNGYQEEISNYGVLSLSVKQKILLARAFSTKPQVLIIQERFDVFSETDRNLILQFIFSKECASTVIFTSHNKLLADNSDAHYHIQNKEIKRLK